MAWMGSQPLKLGISRELHLSEGSGFRTLGGGGPWGVVAIV